jgi:hypothetical protein
MGYNLKNRGAIYAPVFLQISSTETSWRWLVSVIGALILICILTIISTHFYPWNPKPHPPIAVTNDFLFLQQPPVIEVKKQVPVEIIEEVIDTKIFESIWNGAVDISEDFTPETAKPSLIIDENSMFKKAPRDTTKQALMNNYMSLREMQWETEKPMAKAQIYNKVWEGIREREKSVFNEFWLK